MKLFDTLILQELFYGVNTFLSYEHPEDKSMRVPTMYLGLHSDTLPTIEGIIQLSAMPLQHFGPPIGVGERGTPYGILFSPFPAPAFPPGPPIQ